MIYPVLYYRLCFEPNPELQTLHSILFHIKSVLSKREMLNQV